MSALADDILRRIQAAPGRWTIDQLAAATGETVDHISTVVTYLLRLNMVEATECKSADDWRCRAAFHPARAVFIAPCDRPRA